MNMVTQEQIRKAIEDVSDQTTALFKAGEAVIVARRNLETKRAAATVAGEIVGKNEDERKAKAREILAGEYDFLEGAEMAERSLRHDLELAQLELEFVRYSLRLMEVAAKVA